MNTIRTCFLRIAGLMIGILIGWTFSGIAQDTPKLRVAITDFSTTSQNPADQQLGNVMTEWLTTFLVKEQTFETEAEEKFELNMADSEWHRLRLEYRDDFFQYALDGRLLTAISPDTPIDESGDFWLGLSLYAGETKNLLIEFDEISGW